MGQRRVLGAIDVGFADLHVRRICLQRNLVGEGLDRVRIEDVVRRIAAEFRSYLLQAITR